jgi:hypothetical protein
LRQSKKVRAVESSSSDDDDDHVVRPRHTSADREAAEVGDSSDEDR